MPRECPAVAGEGKRLRISRTSVLRNGLSNRQEHITLLSNVKERKSPGRNGYGVNIAGCGRGPVGYRQRREVDRDYPLAMTLGACRVDGRRSDCSTRYQTHAREIQARKAGSARGIGRGRGEHSQ